MNGRSLVIYYRVSTKQQSRSGLGLLAQQDAVKRYLAANPGRVIAELIEVESGRNKERPVIREALWMCRVYDAKLVVARLDRLARSCAMIASILTSGVDFVAADMPLANRFTIHILAAVAEYEARLISERTKAALAAAKARGRKFGCPNPSTAILTTAAREAAAKAIRMRAKLRALDYVPLLCELRDRGETNSRHCPSVDGDGNRNSKQAQRLDRPHGQENLRVRRRTKADPLGELSIERRQARPLRRSPAFAS